MKYPALIYFYELYTSHEGNIYSKISPSKNQKNLSTYAIWGKNIIIGKEKKEEYGKKKEEKSKRVHKERVTERGKKCHLQAGGIWFGK
jgi:hypothetical protein